LADLNVATGFARVQIRNKIRSLRSAPCATELWVNVSDARITGRKFVIQFNRAGFGIDDHQPRRQAIRPLADSFIHTAFSNAVVKWRRVIKG
jgi:hypothetical protein